MNQDLHTFDKVLEYAVRREIESEAFYRAWVEKVNDRAVGAVLEEFAEEERLHKEQLEKVKNGQHALLSGRPAPRFRLPIDVADVQPNPDMTLADALAFAIKKEKAAYRLYLDLAVDSPTEQLMELFLALAREEANHKVRFEIEYDDLTAGAAPR